MIMHALCNMYAVKTLAIHQRSRSSVINSDFTVACIRN